MFTTKSSVLSYYNLLSIIISILFYNLLVQAQENPSGSGPGFPNVNRSVGELLAGPLEEFAGRTAVIAYHQGYIITNIEDAASFAGSSLISSYYDISDPRKPKIFNIPKSLMEVNSFAGAHGYFQEGARLNLKGAFSHFFIDSNNDGRLDTLTGASPGQRFGVQFNNSLPKWGGKGYIYQPYGIYTWFYNDGDNNTNLQLRNSVLGGSWQVTARGLGTLLGNTAFYFGHTDNNSPKGIEVFDLSPLMGVTPTGSPRLLSSIIGANTAQGYWPDLWGGIDPKTGKRLLRVFFNMEDKGYSIWDLSDWQRGVTPTQVCYVPEKKNFQYVRFQDEYAFVEGRKINMIDCSAQIIADDIKYRIELSQFMLPIGNLVVAGGGGFWPRSRGGLAGGVSIWAHQAAPDLRAPEVGYNIPADNQRNYPVKAPISLFISETLRTETVLNGSTLKVQKVSGNGCGNPLPGRVIVTSNQIVQFTPDNIFEPNSTYQLTLTAGGIRDAANNGFNTYSIKFSTGGSIESGSCSGGVVQPTPTNVAPTNTPTNIPLNTSTNTPIPVITNTPQRTPTNILTPTFSPTPVRTNTPQPTSTPIRTPTATPTTSINTSLDIASFNQDVDTGVVSINKNIKFTVVAKGGVVPYSYRWEFGDGRVIDYSNQNSVTHAYSQQGVFNGRLIIRDAQSNIFSRNFSAAVGLAPSERDNVVNSSPIAMSPDKSVLWVANIDNSSVSALDVKNTNNVTLINEFKVCSQPDSVAIANDNSVWISCSGDDRVAVLNSRVLSSGSLQDNLSYISLRYGSAPSGLVFDNNTKAIFVTAQGAAVLYRINSATRSISNVIKLGGTPHALALDQNLGSLYVSSFISSQNSRRGRVWKLSTKDLAQTPLTISLIEDTTSQPSSSAAPGIPNYLSDLAINPQNKQVWVVGKKDNVRSTNSKQHDQLIRSIMMFIDETGKEIVANRIDFDNSAPPEALTFSSSGVFAAIAFQGTNRIAIYNVNKRESLAGVDVGLAPRGILVDEANGRLFTLSLTEETVSVVDAKDLFLTGNGGLKVIKNVASIKSSERSSEVRLGKQIFYNAGDPRMTKQEPDANNTGYFACSTCHFAGGHDGMTWNFSDRGEGLRNTTSLLGQRGDETGFQHWSGNFDEIQDFEHDIRDAFGGTGFLTDQQFNSGNRNKSLGGSKTGVNKELDALAAYVRSLRTFPRSFYKSAANRWSVESSQGAKLFAALNCTSCHSGIMFTDSDTGKRHDVGTILPTSGKRLGGVLDGLDTPTIIGLTHTAPYLHDGSVPTLMDFFGYLRPLSKRIAGTAHDLGSEVTTAYRKRLYRFLRYLDRFNNLDGSKGGFSFNNLIKKAPKLDLDSDTVDDISEFKHFKNLKRDGSGDADGDGVNDRDEIAAGKDPTVKGDGLSIQPTLPPTRAFTNTPNFTPTAIINPTVLPTPLPTPTKIVNVGASCTFEYSILPDSWSTGFNGNLKVLSGSKNNLGKTWRLEYSLPEGVTSNNIKLAWNVAYDITGNKVTSTYKDLLGALWLNGADGNIYTGITVVDIDASKVPVLKLKMPTDVVLNGVSCRPVTASASMARSLSIPELTHKIVSLGENRALVKFSFKDIVGRRNVKLKFNTLKDLKIDNIKSSNKTLTTKINSKKLLIKVRRAKEFNFKVKFSFKNKDFSKALDKFVKGFEYR
jgi:6-phosphogluconolactonase (cycloisomerase 2 family)